MDPPKQFSKIKLLQSIGLLSRNFNPETSKFESSLSLRLLFWVSMISREYFVLKLPVSCFFPQTSRIQLVVVSGSIHFEILLNYDFCKLTKATLTSQGNLFNYLPLSPRFFMGIAGFVAALWGLSFNYVFSWLNTRNDYKLFRIWMRMTLEIPVKNNRDYRVPGLSGKKNKRFWQTEDYVNRIWYRVFNGYIIFISLFFGLQLFFVRWVKNFYEIKRSKENSFLVIFLSASDLMEWR